MRYATCGLQASSTHLQEFKGSSKGVRGMQRMQVEGVRRLVGAGSARGLSSRAASSAGEPVDVEGREVRQAQSTGAEREHRDRVVVLGGSGFVGSAVSRALLAKGAEVIGVSRSGPRRSGDWENQIRWLNADVFDDRSYRSDALRDASAVISCVGGFGTNAEMERINGDSCVTACSAAKEEGVPRFVFISVHDYNLPEQALSNGYFSGKRRGEATVTESFPSSGVILRPGFIYGQRDVRVDPNVLPEPLQRPFQQLARDGISVPLQLIGRPLEKAVGQASELNLTRPFENIPGSDLVLASPLSVDDVGAAAAAAALDPSLNGVLDIESIRATASAHRPNQAAGAGSAMTS